MKMLLYCTKAKPDLVDERKIKKEMPDNLFAGAMKDFEVYPTNQRGSFGYPLNGKIVAECDFEVEEIKPCMSPIDKRPYAYMTRTLERWELTENSCLSFEQLDNYLIGENGYAIHIKNLHIFDKPRELSEYLNNKYWNSHFGNDRVSKAPQNMMRVYKLKDIEWEEYILISIRPQWLCKILNGEKTIEVRKKVLKEMIK